MNSVPQQQRGAPVSAYAVRPQFARCGSEMKWDSKAWLEHHRARTKLTVEDFVTVTPPLVALPVTVTL
jgi:hypothetical protein